MFVFFAGLFDNISDIVKFYNLTNLTAQLTTEQLAFPNSTAQKQTYTSILPNGAQVVVSNLQVIMREYKKGKFK